jgi:Concanavalin A-like lectin/glucanases superfamily/IPT/TIG domain/Putative Ig domain
LWWTKQSDNSPVYLTGIDPQSNGSISEQSVTLDTSGNSAIWMQGPANDTLDNQVVIFHAELVDLPNFNTQFSLVFSANDQAPQVYVDTTAFSAIVNIKTALGARPELWTLSVRNEDRFSYGTDKCDPDTTKEFRMYSADGSTYSDSNYLNTDGGLIYYWTEISPNSEGLLPTRFVIPGLQPECRYQITIGDYRGQQTFSAQSVTFQTKPSSFIAFESIYPAVGPSTGGTTIKLRGAGFKDASDQSRVSTVAIGATEVLFTVLSETEISAVTPPGDVGATSIFITYKDDIGAVAGPEAFHYVDLSIPGSCSDGKVAQWNFNDTSTADALGNSSCGNLNLQRSGNDGTLPVHGVGMNGSAGLQLSNAAFLGISPFNSDTADPTIVPSSLLGLAHYSISAWFQKPASNWGNDGILSWGTAGNAGDSVNLRLQNPGYGGTVCTYWWNWDFCNSENNPPQMHDGNWHNLVTTFNGTERRIYLDGTLVANDFPLSTSGGCHICYGQGITPVFRPGYFAIGITVNDVTFNGNLDNVSVYNRAITPNEIMQEIASNMYKSTQYVGAVGSGISITPLLDLDTLGVTAALANGSTLPAGLTLSPTGILSGTPTSAGTSTVNVVFRDSLNRQTQVAIRLNIAQQSGYRVGDIGPGGGTVVYSSNSATDGTFACGPSLAFTCNAIEVAPRSWYQSLDGTYSDNKDPAMSFSNPENFSNHVVVFNGFDASSTALGAGLSMTLAVVAQNGLFNPVTNVYAAGAAQAYQGGGLNDWYLMNQPESQILAQYPTGVSATGVPAQLGLEDSSNDSDQPGGYWNSWSGNPGASGSATDTTYFNFPSDYMSNNGYEGGYKDKYELFFVRPIRAFYALSQPLVITSPSNSAVIDGTVGTALNTSISATGGLGALTTTISAGTAPSWFHLASNGAITGTPDVASDFTLSFTVTDSQNISTTVTSVRFRITAPVNRPLITSPTAGSTITGMTGTPFNSAVIFTGGTAPVTASITAGTRPSWFNLASNGAITGTPDSAGEFTLSFKVTDSNNETATVTAVHFVIYENFGALRVRGNELTDSLNIEIDRVDALYSQAQSANLNTSQINSLVTQVQTSRNLTQGYVQEANNALSYIASVLSSLDSGNATLALQARDAFNAAVAAAVNAVASANRALALLTRHTRPTISGPSTITGTVGSALTPVTLTLGGGTGSETATVTSGYALPAGLTLSSAGRISGTPNIAGTRAVSFTVTDSLNETATATVEFVISLATAPTSPTPTPVVVKDPPQTSSITESVQGCPSSPNTVLIKGSFLAPISNISINNRMIDRSQWKQSASQVEITVSQASASSLDIQIFNGQIPVLPSQTISVTASCPTPTATPTPIPTVTPTPVPTITPVPTPTATPKPSVSPTPSPKPVLKKTITCVKGKVSKKVTGTNPKCPKGYTLKKPKN